MRNTVICVLALVLGVELALGMSSKRRLIKKLQLHRGPFDTWVPGDSLSVNREISVAEIKGIINEMWERRAEECPNRFQHDCSAVSEHFSVLMDLLYEDEESYNHGEITAVANTIENTLLSLGLSDQEVSCTMETCAHKALQEKQKDGGRLPFCQFHSPGFQDMEFGIYGDRVTEHPEEGHRDDDEKWIRLFMCGVETVLYECQGLNDECAGIVAEMTYDYLVSSFREMGPYEFQKRSHEKLVAENYRDSLSNRIDKLFSNNHK